MKEVNLLILIEEVKVVLFQHKGGTCSCGRKIEYCTYFLPFLLQNYLHQTHDFGHQQISLLDLKSKRESACKNLIVATPSCDFNI